MPAPLRRISVRLTIPLAVIAPALAVGLLLVSGFWVRSRDAGDAAAARELDQIHARIADRLGSLLAIPQRTAAFNAARIRSVQMDPDDPRAWLVPMFDTVSAFEVVDSVTWGDRSGRATWVARHAGDDHFTYAILDDPSEGRLREFVLDDVGRPGEEPIADYPFDPRDRPWYAAAADAGRPTWSEPFAWIAPDGLSATLGISYGVPIMADEGELVGVIDSEVTLYELSVFLARLDLPEGGVACILDHDGSLIATSVHEPVVTTEGERVLARDAVDARVRAAGLAPPGRSRPILDDGTAFAAVEDLGLDDLPPWRVVMIAPEAAFLADARAARERGLLIAGLAVAGAALIGLLLAALIVRPIVRLRGEAARIGAGDLEARVDVQDAPEFAELSGAMNTMVDGLKDRLGLRHALAVAMEVQQGLLPAETPRVPGLDIAGHSSYCDETGGDYYDYLDIAGLEHDATAIAVGDVMGHGVAAAMLMATARGILRSHATEQGELGTLLRHLNDLLVVDTGGTRFMTMLLMTLQDGVIRWASAGHPAPFILRPGQDSFDEQAFGGLPLGVAPDESYEEHTTDPLPPGTLVVASTDGLWEAADTENRQFGMERLTRVLADHRDEPAERIAEAIRGAHAAFVGSQPQDDDITFVVVRVGEIGPGGPGQHP